MSDFTQEQLELHRVAQQRGVGVNQAQDIVDGFQVSGEYQIVTLTVTARLDPVPGTFHDPESWREQVQHMLNEQVGHYFPIVRVEKVEQ